MARAIPPSARGVLAQFEERVATSPHAVYEVRRVAKPTLGAKPRISRSLRRFYEGSRENAAAYLAAQGPVQVGADGIARIILRERAESARHLGGADTTHVEVPTDATAEERAEAVAKAKAEAEEAQRRERRKVLRLNKARSGRNRGTACTPEEVPHTARLRPRAPPVSWPRRFRTTHTC